MGLTSSLFVGLTGMKTNEFRMDVIGNNIANVNTYGYKSQRATFESTFSQTFSFGSPPASGSGGTNPRQVGTGVGVASVDRDFTGGAPETTGVGTDLAIEGEGLFVLLKSDGSRVYTRDGNFQFNSENYLVSSDGFYLRGYGIDDGFNIIEGSMTNIRIGLGEITTATKSTKANFTGNLNSEGSPGVARPKFFSQELTDAGGVPSGATLLTDLEEASNPGTSLFQDGDIVTASSIRKGGAVIGAADLEVTATTTLDDFMSWTQGVLGISDDSDLKDLTGETVPYDVPGVTLADDGLGNYYIQIIGNIGEDSNFAFGGNTAASGSDGFSTVSPSSAATPSATKPFTFTDQNDDDTVLGESVRTSFDGYDSLGTPISISVTMVMETQNDTGTTWRWFAESPDDMSSPVDRNLGTGTIKFNSNGQFIQATGETISISRTGTGADTPQTVTLDFSGMYGNASVNGNSTMTLLSQDGFESGTLSDFAVGTDGIITGAFTNGLSRTLGQVVLATFRNYGGLIATGDNVYQPGPNAGTPTIKAPQDLGAGTVRSAALELSNVDLSREFINLIVSSTGFSASSRVIQTSDQLLTELMAMMR